MPAGLVALLALGMFGRYSLTIYQVRLRDSSVRRDTVVIFLGWTEVLRRHCCDIVLIITVAWH